MDERLPTQLRISSAMSAFSIARLPMNTLARALRNRGRDPYSAIEVAGLRRTIRGDKSGAFRRRADAQRASVRRLNTQTGDQTHKKQPQGTKKSKLNSNDVAHSDTWANDFRRMTRRQKILYVAYLAAAQDEIRYSEGADRMSGIAHHTQAPGTPAAADCSSFATWVYYAAGAKDPNGGHYSAKQVAYTGTLWGHGSSPTGGPKPGDLVFFGNPYGPTAHVAIYIGRGECISQGGPDDGPRIVSLQAEAAYEGRGYYGFRSYGLGR